MKNRFLKLFSFLFLGIGLALSSCGGNSSSSSGELKVTLSTTSHTMNVDSTFVLTATVEGVEKNTLRCYFDSDNIQVCNVKTDPETRFQTTITSYKTGTTNVNVTLYTYSDNTQVYTTACQIIVEGDEPYITFANDKETIFTHESTTKTLSVSHSSSLYPSFSSSDTSIASVNSSGVVTAKKQGLTTITAYDGSISDTCEVWVVPGKGTGTNLVQQSQKAARDVYSTWRWHAVEASHEYCYIDDQDYIHVNINTLTSGNNYWLRYVLPEDTTYNVNISYYCRNYDDSPVAKAGTKGSSYAANFISGQSGTYTGTFIQDSTNCFQIKFSTVCEIVLKVSLSK